MTNAGTVLAVLFLCPIVLAFAAVAGIWVYVQCLLLRAWASKYL